MDGSRVRALGKLGQSVWCDEVSRALIESGRLRSLVTDFGVTGLSSNPTIFRNAMASDGRYGSELGFLDTELSDGQVYERLVVADIRDAADALSGIYQMTQGADGYASLEVSPELAGDAAATIEEARRLLALVGRPNVMVKIPATSEGLRAFEVLLAEGISVDVTLIFGLSRYAQVVEAYIAGLQRALDGRLSLLNVASVASIFISRVDSAVSQAIHSLAQRGVNLQHQSKLRELGQMAGTANGRLAYQMFKDAFADSSFDTFRAAGARPQRICWSSMTTKDPSFKETKYVEELIAPDTVVDLPVALIEAFLDHGSVAEMTSESIAEARTIVTELHDLGIDVEEIAVDLERAGLDQFRGALADTLRIIRERRRAGDKR